MTLFLFPGCQWPQSQTRRNLRYHTIIVRAASNLTEHFGLTHEAGFGYALQAAEV